jgi:hypothetical protein
VVELRQISKGRTGMHVVCKASTSSSSTSQVGKQRKLMRRESEEGKKDGD